MTEKKRRRKRQSFHTLSKEVKTANTLFSTSLFSNEPSEYILAHILGAEAIAGRTAAVLKAPEEARQALRKVDLNIIAKCVMYTVVFGVQNQSTNSEKRKKIRPCKYEAVRIFFPRLR